MEQRGPCDALKTLDCWLLMWADSWAQATGGMVAASLGQLVESYGGAAHSQTFYVTLFSVGNATGRVLLGTLTDAAVRQGAPRSVGLLAVSILFTAVGLLGGLSVSLSVLYAITVTAGLAMGGASAQSTK
eukprot:SAG31_NODE_13506_length_864_cov_1.508497_2_plen_130_part_00